MTNELDGTLMGKLFTLVEECVEDYVKVKNSGVKTASVRARHKLIEIRNLIKPIRKEILRLREEMSQNKESDG